MGWHSDAEKNLKKNGAIASKFWCRTKISFKHRDSKETVSQNLSHGSLLVMKDETKLAAPLTPLPHTTTPRVNLTFRTITIDFFFILRISAIVPQVGIRF
jgi:alkylated DNA repair dioxygenase AlkB